MAEDSVTREVRRFYDQVGWQKVSAGTYQNAQYEDLRPVSRAYIHKCHLRINRHISRSGKYLLDAGSGPIQYPEYLTYSKGYKFRVCLDISIVALEEARDRIGAEHGLFVVADVSHLPFREDVFDGIVSLHTLHHLEQLDYIPAYIGLKRVLNPGKSAVVVNGWGYSPIMRMFAKPVEWMERLTRRSNTSREEKIAIASPARKSTQKPAGTHVHKLTPGLLRDQLGSNFPIDIHVWRTPSVRFLRAMIQPWLLGRFWLWLLYQLEEISPAFFGKNGQYPMIIFNKEIR
jgi:SAM-dependent methyltransferase